MNISRRIVLRVGLALTVGLLCLGLAGCGNSSSPNKTASPTPTPHDAGVKAAKSEDDFQNEGDDEYRNRAEVRRAVAEFVKAKLPNWTLKGVSATPYQSNVFWVGADIEKDSRGVVVELVARKFFPESGDPYWRVVSLRKTLDGQLHDMSDADTLKRLNEATNTDSGEP